MQTTLVTGPKNDKRSPSVSELWPIWLAVVSALVFALGYVTLLAFFSGLTFDVIPPTVIYGPTQILAVGVVGFLGHLITPLLLFFSCFALAKVTGICRDNKFSLLMPWLMALTVSAGLLWLMKYWVPYRDHPSFLAHIFEDIFSLGWRNLRDKNLVMAFLVILIIVCTFAGYQALHQRYKFSVVVFIGWWITFSFADGVALAHRVGLELACEDASILKQNVALRGAILTKGKLTPTSTPISAPHDGFETRGVYLAKVEGDYYFVPTFVQGSDASLGPGVSGCKEMGKFRIVPADDFLGFVKSW